MYSIYVSNVLLVLIFSLISCLSIISLKSFFAIGAAVELPDPPCSITTLIAYLGFLYGPNAMYKAWSLSLYGISNVFNSKALCFQLFF